MFVCFILYRDRLLWNCAQVEERMHDLFMPIPFPFRGWCKRGGGDDYEGKVENGVVFATILFGQVIEAIENRKIFHRKLPDTQLANLTFPENQDLMKTLQRQGFHKCLPWNHVQCL